MKEIILNARYGYKHALEYIADNLWQLKLDPKALQTWRVIGNYPNDIKAIDPDGGPFLSVGSKINEYTIKSIMPQGVLELIKEN
jgi:hypothetical protein